MANANDTLVSVRAPVGDINRADEECCVGRGVAAVRHKSGAASYTYYAMESLYPEFGKFEAEGTVFGSINKKNFEGLKLVIPPEGLISKFEGIAASIDAQIQNLEVESRTLGNLRDTLMPKLLCGTA